MLIFIRHSEDEENKYHPYDGSITPKGRKLAQKQAEELISRHGYPKRIYCSPFRRTRQTLKSMLSVLSDKERKRLEHRTRFDVRLSRYFTRQEKLKPRLARSTDELGDIPVHESGDEMEVRIKDFLKRSRKYQQRDKVIWVVTHAIPYKRAAAFHDTEIPEHIPFMHYFIVD